MTIAWKLRIDQVTHSYSRRLPALGQFYRETKFSKFPWFQPEFPNKNMRQVGPGIPDF